MAELMAGPVNTINPEITQNLADFVVASFRFSQGGPYLQGLLSQYAFQKIGEETVRTHLYAAIKAAHEPIVEIVTRRWHVLDAVKQGPDEIVEYQRMSEEKVKVELQGYQGACYQWLYSDDSNKTATLKHKTVNDLQIAIGEQVLRRDKMYATSKSSDSKRTIGATDGKYFSHFMRHAVVGISAGVPIVTEMFAEIGKRAQTGLANDGSTETADIRHLIDEVAEAHIEAQGDSDHKIANWLEARRLARTA